MAIVALIGIATISLGLGLGIWGICKEHVVEEPEQYKFAEEIQVWAFFWLFCGAFTIIVGFLSRMK